MFRPIYLGYYRYPIGIIEINPLKVKVFFGKYLSAPIFALQLNKGSLAQLV